MIWGVGTIASLSSRIERSELFSTNSSFTLFTIGMSKILCVFKISNIPAFVNPGFNVKCSTSNNT